MKKQERKRKQAEVYKYRREFICYLKQKGIRDTDIAKVLRVSRQRLGQIKASANLAIDKPLA